MSFRTVVISKSAKLDLKINHLIVRDPEITKIHISEIAVLIIENTAISLTCALLAELIKQKVKVIFCDEKRNPLSELIPYYGSHDCSLKLSLQKEWKEEIKQKVWAEIIKQKIAKQMEVLKFYEKDEHVKLAQYIKEVEINDSSNREGHAAKVYFNALFGKTFTRHDDCFTNAGLNYGYAVLLSAFNREIVSAGYLTQMGIFHKNMYNPFNLSCDFIEAFRPIVDFTVKAMSLTKFEKEEKMKIVDVLNKEVFIGGKKQYLINAIKLYVSSAFDTLNEEENAQIKVYALEL